VTKLTTRDLNTVFSIAKQNTVDLSDRGLDSQAFIAKCWIMAVDTFLGLADTVEFPKQTFPEPED